MLVDVTSLPETLAPLVVSVAILSETSGALEEADEMKHHWVT